jgi:arginyl-tRNA synthetase
VLAAIKYAFAKNKLGANIVYDPKSSVTLEGNSGPYLQYAHARARSIMAKASEAGAKAMHPVEVLEGERQLLLSLGDYRPVVERSMQELLPHHICTYLYELSQTFNRFYEHNRVIGDKRQAQRLWLVERYAEILRDGLSLLGINAPDRM